MKFLFYLIIIIISERASLLCTDSDMIPACIRTYKQVHVIINCCDENVTKIYKYFDNLQKNGTSEIEKIVIRSETIDTLRPFLFGQLQVRYIEIDFKGLLKLDIRTFRGQNNIKVLKLKNTQLSQIPIKIVNQLTELLILKFDKFKKVTSIADYAFEGVQSSNIYLVSFYGNNIRYIGEGAFSNLVRLSFLDLASNQLKEINVNIFPKKLTALKILAMDNLLTEIPSALISKMKPSSHLLLVSNQISNVNETTIVEIITKELRVDLTFNPINCSCSFGKLAEYNSIMDTGEYVTKTARCNAPVQLSRMPLHSLQTSFFQNCTETTPMTSSALTHRDTAGIVNVDLILLSTLLLKLADLLIFK
ncbi:Uncharacterised protein g2076 [Pycnogonum litorale]